MIKCDLTGGYRWLPLTRWRFDFWFGLIWSNFAAQSSGTEMRFDFVKRRKLRKTKQHCGICVGPLSLSLKLKPTSIRCCNLMPTFSSRLDWSGLTQLDLTRTHTKGSYSLTKLIFGPQLTLRII